jgi:hypothetical protein
MVRIAGKIPGYAKAACKVLQWMDANGERPDFWLHFQASQMERASFRDASVGND